jgi:hypothetical protein
MTLMNIVKGNGIKSSTKLRHIFIAISIKNLLFPFSLFTGTLTAVTRNEFMVDLLTCPYLVLI